MDLELFYRTIDGDLEELMERLGSRNLLIRLLGKFKNDTNLAALEEAFEKEDIKAAFMAVHTLKGVALNLGFSHLARASSFLTEVLRPYGAVSPGQAPPQCPPGLFQENAALLAKVKEEYEKIQRALD